MRKALTQIIEKKKNIRNNRTSTLKSRAVCCLKKSYLHWKAISPPSSSLLTSFSSAPRTVVEFALDPFVEQQQQQEMPLDGVNRASDEADASGFTVWKNVSTRHTRTRWQWCRNAVNNDDEDNDNSSSSSTRWQRWMTAYVAFVSFSGRPNSIRLSLTQPNPVQPSDTDTRQSGKITYTTTDRISQLQQFRG